MNAMGNRWYFQRDEAEVGPISFSGLRRMALEGLIDRETPVRAGANGQWTPAGDIEPLYAPRQQRMYEPG